MHDGDEVWRTEIAALHSLAGVEDSGSALDVGREAVRDAVKAAEKGAKKVKGKEKRKAVEEDDAVEDDG